MPLSELREEGKRQHMQSKENVNEENKEQKEWKHTKARLEGWVMRSGGNVCVRVGVCGREWGKITHSCEMSD